jgi:hypothetical protein
VVFDHHHLETVGQRESLGGKQFALRRQGEKAGEEKAERQRRPKNAGRPRDSRDC